MRVDVLSLFPEAFTGPLDVSILGRARRDGLIDVQIYDIREHATDRHRSVDDYPYGGGQGMVLRVDVLDRALGFVQEQAEQPAHVIYMSPVGERLSDSLARELARMDRINLVCGRYEGVDERFIELRVDREVSIGDYVVTGGELPAMVLIDAVARHIPGALGDEASAEEESFAGDGMLEHPQYTRPPEYAGLEVPDTLRSGSHADIAAWKHNQRLERTRARRPELAPPLPYPDSPRPRNGAPWIRSFRTEDTDRVTELFAESDSRIMSGTAPLCVVAEYRRRIVGFASASHDDYHGYINELKVAESSRHFGVATRLLEELECRFRTLGCHDLRAIVPATTELAVEFFRHRGWHAAAGAVMTKQLED